VHHSKLGRPTSAVGQTEKVSQRAFLDRCTPESGRGFVRGERQLRANCSREQLQQFSQCRVLKSVVVLSWPTAGARFSNPVRLHTWASRSAPVQGLGKRE
jgi:hypothetical protein